MFWELKSTKGSTTEQQLREIERLRARNQNARVLWPDDIMYAIHRLIGYTRSAAEVHLDEFPTSLKQVILGGGNP